MQDFSYLVKIIWPGRLLLGFINISNRIGEKQDVRLCGLKALHSLLRPPPTLPSSANPRRCRWVGFQRISQPESVTSRTDGAAKTENTETRSTLPAFSGAVFTSCEATRDRGPDRQHRAVQHKYSNLQYFHHHIGNYYYSNISIGGRFWVLHFKGDRQ